MKIVRQSSGYSLRYQVAQFHEAYDIKNRETPGIPDVETVRCRLRLIAEEFLELLEAAGCDLAEVRCCGYEIRATIAKQRDANVNLPDFADACGDLDYVVEGARQAFGIDGTPIADAIHRANMEKLHDGEIVKDAGGKVIKPEGWTPPDIAAELREQGWDGK